MLSEEQIEAIALLSDEVLYREAVAFMQQFLEDENEPLPNSQMNGLLSISLALNYRALRDFVTHQIQRNWPAHKRNIENFYKKLDQYMDKMQKKRLKNEFHLLSEQAIVQAARTQTEELMTQLMAEFIQHLAAENSYLLAVQEQQNRQKKASYSRSE